MGVTVNEIAAKCQVSRTTVVRALNNQSRISNETRKRILDAANEMGYRPNLLARSLNKGRSMMIGMVAINMENQIFVETLNAINKAVQGLGYSLNIALNGEDCEAEKCRIQEFADRRMEGILLSPVNKGTAFETFLLSLHVPVVCIGNHVSDHFSTVMVDEAQAARDAVKLILSKGYQRVVFVCPPLAMEAERNVFSHVQRASGFHAELDLHPEIESLVIKGENYFEQLSPVLETLEKRTAILCSGDIYALNIMRRFKELKIRTPRDVGIMGFDNISMLDYIVPRLTTVSTNSINIASVAVNELINHISDQNSVPKKIVLPHQIMDMETL